MSIKLRSVTPVESYRPVELADFVVRKLSDDEISRRMRCEYVVSHSNGKTTVWNELYIDHTADGTYSGTMFIQLDGLSSPEAVVDKLADWLERLAAGMREGKVTEGFPLELGAKRKEPEGDEVQTGET